MRTTEGSRGAQRPEAETNRERAWAHMLENPGGIRRMATDSPYGHRRLGEVSRRYDQICQRAQGLLQPDVSETDILAALLTTRALRQKLNNDELMLITLARSKRITWSRIADALEMKNRQSAERRHLQLSQATGADGRLPRTQNERVEDARELRSRRAERDWARDNGTVIHKMAQVLTAIPDLQERANRSQEAALMAAPVKRDGTKPEAVHMTWPAALKQCLAEHARFCSAPETYLSPERDGLDDDQWQLQQQETDILHRMLGLLRYAADPRHLDLSDHPNLHEKIARFDQRSQLQPRN
ncbi:hypothetical protein ACFU98_38560 [Streptomyces sp. NPDC057575]|uniref:hypothetical protein n=1 Tax=unclassified Streptomyces TaxID=2593676 RepID=UPI0036ADD009